MYLKFQVFIVTAINPGVVVARPPVYYILIIYNNNKRWIN